MNNKTFSTQRYVIQTVDPVHIGTGGMRLGRVDNSIVREPGTKLPKIPGTSLSGAIRHYAAYRYEKKQCAGKDNHCGHPTCPICYTFGYSKGTANSYSGVVSIGDARIVFFPVYSMAGPVWVTGDSALKDFGITGQSVSDDKAKMSDGLSSYKHLNLGWLMVEKEGELILPDLPTELSDTVKNRIVLVSDKFFSQIVNSNLEVRTSVSINPDTGAADDGALFTYEAIPRAAFLWFDVVQDDFRRAFPSRTHLDEWKNILSNATKDKAEKLLKDFRLLSKDDDFDKVRNALLTWIDAEPVYKEKTSITESIGIISQGLEWAEHLGIGGMGTRGFGRIRKVKEVMINGKNS